MDLTAGEPRRLFAAIDMGTNTFKIVIAYTQTTPSPLLLPILRLSSPVHLTLSSSSSSLSSSSISLSLSTLRSFSLLLSSLPQPQPPLRAVATAALRRATNSSSLLSLSPLPIRILSGHEEARLTYLAVLHFLPLHRRRSLLLTVDIGGGSTEFVVGLNGDILFSTSLDLGHVTLTESFLRSGTMSESSLVDLRRHVCTVLDRSELIEKVKEIGFEIAVGSSGTVKAIEKAISGKDYRRRWRFEREELETLVEKMETEFDVRGVEGVRKLGFSKRRAEFAVAGAVLLAEIFDAVGIEEMEVSGFALAEGVIAEMMEEEEKKGNDSSEKITEIDMSENSRWRSVVGLAVRFDGGDERMKLGVECIGIAKEIFDGIRRFGVLESEEEDEGSKPLVSLEEKDLVYIEAGIMLHNIGRVFDKKKYHKVSYKIIKNGGHLHGYSSEEIEIIALLARFHRKKFPTCEHASLQSLPVEIKKKFRFLCIITRLSFGLRQFPCVISQGLEVVHTTEGFKLLVHCQRSQWTSAAIEEALRVELEHFEEVFEQELRVTVNNEV